MGIAITGGGTGGHLAVARAIKEELNRQGVNPIFIGSINGQDRTWFEDDEGWEATYFLDTRGVVNKNLLGKFSALWDIIKASKTSISLFQKHAISTVISVGGYSAAPASFAAVATQKKLVIHEQNAVTGRLNTLLRSKASLFCSSFDPQSPCKDYPIAHHFFGQGRIRSRISTIIFLGGSQGAQAINDLAMALTPRLITRGIRIIHQTGRNDYDRVATFYKRNCYNVDVFPFDKDIVTRYAQADLAISRAGASALFELAANALPTVFVPYPHAAGDHQKANAKFLVDRNLGWMMEQNTIDPDAIIDLLAQDLSTISEGLQNFIQPHGARCIVDAILRGEA